MEGNVKRYWTTDEVDEKLAQYRKELASLRSENEKLKAFKDYVHKRLDDAGIPIDPESPHKAAGCRIGGRLDVVLGDISKLKAERQELVEAIGEMLQALNQCGPEIGWNTSSYIESAYAKLRDIYSKSLLDKLNR